MTREIIILSCTRCDHRWVQRGKEKPMQCARCRNCAWDRPKIRFAKKPVDSTPTKSENPSAAVE